MADLHMYMTDDVNPQAHKHTSDTDPFSITAIGSCRIVGPLRILQQKEPVVLNQSGVYGYSHSCTELRKHLTHLLNDTRPPQELMPVLAPREDAPTQVVTRHKPSDYYVFELSSAKHLSVEGHPVQLNYLNRHFRDFFSNVDRTRAFWAKAKALNPKDMEDFLIDIPEYRALPESDQKILRNLELRSATPETLRQDIDAIRNKVPDHLFITHFDAISKDGHLLKARAEYLKMVRAALIECNAKWYDPTQSIVAFGQDLALDDPEASLSHFSYSFEQYLANNWWLRFIAPVCKEKHMDSDLRNRIRQTAKAVKKTRQSALI